MEKVLNDNLFYLVSSYVVSQQKMSINDIKDKFNVDDETMNMLLKKMESECIISCVLDNNEREVLMEKDEFDSIFENPNAIRKVSSNRSSLLYWLLFLLFLFLLYLLFRRFVFVKEAEVLVPMKAPVPVVRTYDDIENQESKVGWIKEGNYYNYYDLNGNKKFNSVIDDGGKYYYVDDNGNLATNRWVEYYGKTFYVDSEGEMLRNCWIGDYYVGNDGNVLKNTITPDGYSVGNDGRYIVETTVAEETYIPPTIEELETVAIIDIRNDTDIAPNVIQENIVSQTQNETVIVPTIESTYTYEILEPTAPANVIDNSGMQISSNNKNYKISDISTYRQKGYLSIDKQCTVQIEIPNLVDKDGNEVVQFKEGMIQEEDNIVTELLDIADSSVEENGDSYVSYKYISSISFQEARIKSQDAYSLVIREVGKCHWNTGKSSRIELIIDYDKVNGSMSFYVEE